MTLKNNNACIKAVDTDYFCPVDGLNIIDKSNLNVHSFAATLYRFSFELNALLLKVNSFVPLNKSRF